MPAGWQTPNKKPPIDVGGWVPRRAGIMLWSCSSQGDDFDLDESVLLLHAASVGFLGGVVDSRH